MQFFLNKLLFRAVLGMVALFVVAGVMLAGNADIDKMRDGPPRSSAVVLDAGLSNPVMALAYEELHAEGALGTQPGEARLTLPSPDGPIVLTPTDIDLLNARYREIRGL